jgi:hypothetical protein
MKKTLLILITIFSLSTKAQDLISFETSEGYSLTEIEGQGPTDNVWELFNSGSGPMDGTLATVSNNIAATGSNSLRFDSDFSEWNYYAGVFSPVFVGYGDEFIVRHSFYPDSDADSDYVFTIYGFDGTSSFLVSYARFNYLGNIQFADGVLINNVGTYSAGEWYDIQVERTSSDIILKVNGTTLVSYPAFDSGSMLAVYLGFRFDNYGSGFSIDDITVEGTASSASFDMNRVSIYPNPANEFLNITGEDGLTINSISIVDLNGRTVKEVQLNVSNSQINVSDLSSGAYLINLNTSEGKAVKKFIKK